MTPRVVTGILQEILVSLAGTLNNLASKIVNFSFKISSFSSS